MSIIAFIGLLCTFLLQKLNIHCDNNVVIKFDAENEVFDVYEKQ